MATIKDVADATGLSRSTVSRVINRHPYVAKEKKLLVEEAMKQLGYTPNSLAQRLRKRKTETIAVIVPRIANPFFSQLVESMEMVAGEHNFQLVVCQTNNNKQRELKYLNLIKTKQVDGIILTSIDNDWEVIKEYTNYGPIIFCNEYDENAGVPTVKLDQFKGGYIGTTHLIERGYTKVACCCGFFNSSLTDDRIHGYRTALKERGLPFRDEWCRTNAFSIDDGKRILRDLMHLEEPPDAVFTGSDEVAAGMIKEAKQLGVVIPEEFGVLGFDDQPIAELMEPGITTIHQPVKEIGKKAMEIMLSYDSKPLNEIVELPLHLVVRGST
ncbi:LacI family DNA-binding transcriptional regulator [Thalassobacillus pellis]|uniref:LacI family DNA-binding transcriptional regulator n=1 Tax=Thalassobacillus pellis TaxID=748008 RepID=UPI0019601D32|nr:LacI family DNA-binding transcriptional regulator [Thalassobacillus pellis]MBM7553534.1 LacI family transcriptional regulator [Thalassobacillus pellis]